MAYPNPKKTWTSEFNSESPDLRTQTISVSVYEQKTTYKSFNQEERLKDLEQRLSDCKEENTGLRRAINRLKEENKRLKERELSWAPLTYGIYDEESPAESEKRVLREVITIEDDADNKNDLEGIYEYSLAERKKALKRVNSSDQTAITRK